MRTAFATKFVAGLIVITLGAPPSITAGTPNRRSWQNLQQLNSGQQIEIMKTHGESVRGAFVSFADQSVTVRDSSQDITVGRPDIARIRLRSGKSRKYGWIGAAIGAGAGAGVGAGISQRLSDFSNLRPAIIGVTVGIGALIGAGIGLAIGGRHTTIYSK